MNHLPWITIAVAFAFALEWTVVEPPERVHPVVWFGAVVAPVDREWSRPLAVGTAAAIGLPLGAAAVVGGAVYTGSLLHPLAAVALAGIALFSTTSLRMLTEMAAETVVATEADPEAARERLPALVGRDPSELSPAQMRSAAVESAAENLSDGLVAPLLAFAALAPLSLALGAAAAAWVKGVNTLDSMLGYREKRVGTPAARLDDATMWVPARASALLLSTAARSPDPVLAARRWARKPDSPNAGWPMGTLAAATGVRLEKPGGYDLNPVASLPTAEDARRGVAVVGRAGVLAYALAALWGVMLWAL